ncbi:zinc finger CCCH domain-containing protein 53-like isoform X2 [Ipomoea triloba]|uniref:zinc finger CCCH domain-containing protein 53-like isoform X2 n=1 Tax=Ipomoea triloba TaxID=35885 RepID=UPI00125D78F7|nr:zinc finger CCCH domain-containing protein 53-like isoform X2 [Ipomoea triloba]
MDAYEATKVVFQRIQSLDPENASKIMGLLLIQDHGEKEMIRLAFGPESLLQSVIVKTKIELGLSPNSPSTPSSPSPFGNSISVPFSRQNSSSSGGSGRILGGGGINLPSPLSINTQSNASNSWANSSFSEFQSPEGLVSPSPSANGVSSMNSAAPPFYGGAGVGEVDLIDEFQLQDQLSFLNDGSPTLGAKNPDIFYPHQDLASSPNGDSGLFSSYSAGWGGGGFPHRRSCSVSDICLGGSDDPNGGFGWKPCLYYARGYCKNGNSCRFLHGGSGDGGGGGDAGMVGSPSKFEMMEQCQEILRSKSSQQQRLAAASQLMAASSTFPYSPVSANKCMNFLLQQQHLQAESPRAAAALMLGDEVHKFSRTRFERGDFGMNLGANNSSSRQIYLTFPADSTFKEEDVSNYFSNYGPVQDVRIPYQQKRMFGFVTFVYPETVKIILAKGNPHFVCDARVLVKPYKEKGKVPEKFRKQHQQQEMERGEFPGCGSPSGLESRDPYDLQLGARMLYNSQDMLWRRKLEEQVDLQQAIELQSRRLMNLQLLDVKRSNHHRAFSTGAVISSPVHSPGFVGHNVVFPTSQDSSKENGFAPKMVNQASVGTEKEVQQSGNVSEKEKEPSKAKDENGNDKENKGENELPESVEHNLPDSPFASPGDSMSAFLNDVGEAEKPSSGTTNNLIASPLFPASDMTPLKSCYLEVARFPSGSGAIGM